MQSGRTTAIFEVCPARLLAVGHDAILIGIVVSDLDSSPSPLAFPPRFRPSPRSASPLTYLVIESESIFIYEDCRGMGDGTVVRSIKLIDSSNTSFAAPGVDWDRLSRFRFVRARARDILSFTTIDTA